MSSDRTRNTVVTVVALLTLMACLSGAAFAAGGTSTRSSGAALPICKGKYALCDAALCTPIPEQHGYPGAPTVKPSHALCACVVEDGENLGPGPCSEREPRGKNGEYILSTYSYALSKPYLTCPAGGDRTVCFGYPCIIDSQDTKRAHCTCPITYNSAEFKTQGGDCQATSCSSGLWQGGTPKEYDVINTIFSRKTKQPPPPDCPGTSSKK